MQRLEIIYEIRVEWKKKKTTTNDVLMKRAVQNKTEKIFSHSYKHLLTSKF